MEVKHTVGTVYYAPAGGNNTIDDGTRVDYTSKRADINNDSLTAV